MQAYNHRIREFRNLSKIPSVEPVGKLVAYVHEIFQYWQWVSNTQLFLSDPRNK